eukprot:2730825-Amphidinium_carterae.3
MQLAALVKVMSGRVRLHNYNRDPTIACCLFAQLTQFLSRSLDQPFVVHEQSPLNRFNSSRKNPNCSKNVHALFHEVGLPRWQDK